MKHHARLVIAATILATTIAGCAGAVGPTASPTTPPATATPSPTSEPTPVPTWTPTPGPTLIPYPGPSIPPGTLTIEIGADPYVKFDRTSLAAPADTPFVIAFDNRDTLPPGNPSGLPIERHNVAIKLGSDLIFNPLPALVGPAKANYFISEGLPAGTYQFLCILHPVMHGTLTIE